MENPRRCKNGGKNMVRNHGVKKHGMIRTTPGWGWQWCHPPHVVGWLLAGHPVLIDHKLHPLALLLLAGTTWHSSVQSSLPDIDKVCFIDYKTRTAREHHHALFILDASSNHQRSSIIHIALLSSCVLFCVGLFYIYHLQSSLIYLPASTTMYLDNYTVSSIQFDRTKCTNKSRI